MKTAAEWMKDESLLSEVLVRAIQADAAEAQRASDAKLFDWGDSEGILAKQVRTNPLVVPL